MPHTIFFDVRGHAIHGFFDVKHLGLPVSHGCVRLSPVHAATLFNLVKTEGMNQTTIVVSGHTPAGGARSLASYDTQAYYRQPQSYSDPYRQQQTYYPPQPTLLDQLLRLFSPK